MLRQKLIPIFTALLITLSFSPNLQAAGSQVSIASDEKCYGPDCEWYQRLLNTLPGSRYFCSPSFAHALNYE
ncbi:hypothetical protein BOW53_07135 [Solemya pervernicosa gill symbiont]|uniref:Uncharacterized protein n=1 Tax=Solemya pervernicosa gill symbiont TaxID=642797 RepID=A0A1T2L689_9GAMM|nr:hypothetical protein [Solemya pervernicosa gill symbiont]OOZ40619.1 hypothetical protein BOW53_07135 [Solemya pervernicosa gill symbiont]